MWTAKTNTASDNGVFHGWTSESNCKAECLKQLSCVAIDMGPVGCVLHYNASDLTNSYYVDEVTQFVLDRYCLSTSSVSTKSPTTTTTSVGNATGKALQYLAMS